MAELYAITLWQPWASLLFTTSKPDETRSWEPPARIRGQRMAIHASVKRVPRAYITLDVDLICVRHFGVDWRKTLPFGEMIGSAVLSGFREISEPVVVDHRLLEPNHADNRACGDWTPGRFAWRFAEHQLFTPPIPAVGRQGIFKFDMEAHRG